ncbi:DUF6998 domain-containing protein [Lentibacillus cibarius]|uniref:DUF6998 domain-containing protein n=1 Tax=Lentibacillus cibarius TaxID=2583219 RepID=A0A5S3QJ87_9BACI|nr:hypothetical protein [Lentibacillus cibarius]TMN21898.1 hypothetical protein FFL34_07055 [Lentibacillus cibarius]
MEKDAIISFFKSVKELREKGVVRSDKYLGDIGEYICQQKYGIELCQSGRQKGYDGIKGGKKYQIKFHNSAKRTNEYFGDPDEYDLVLLVVGPSSLLRNDQHYNKFHIYEINSEYVKENFRQKSGYCCGKEKLSKMDYDVIAL